MTPMIKLIVISLGLYVLVGITTKYARERGGQVKMVKTYWVVDDELDEEHTKEIIEGSGFVAVEVLKKSEVNFLVKSLIKNLQKELGRLSSYPCDTPDKAIEQRIKIEQTHVEITHLCGIMRELNP